MSEQFLFQYCQKLVVFSADLDKVLLCRRKGEADYDGTYSFIGGKMERTDESLVASAKREKDEEIGAEAVIDFYPTFSYNVLWKKNDGTPMVLPHYFARYVEGEIVLNEEYDEFQWVPVDDLGAFEPKVPNIPDVVASIKLLRDNTDKLESVII